MDRYIKQEEKGNPQPQSLNFWLKKYWNIYIYFVSELYIVIHTSVNERNYKTVSNQ